MGNTSVLAMAIPLTPVTLAWGPSVAYVVMITFGFAATATAWYFVLSRYAGLTRVAAFLGAGFCAFAPGMLSQASGHAHIQAQFLVPLIVWRVFRLKETARPVRDGVLLGLLITAQVFIGEETLFITALACGVCALIYAVARRRALAGQVRPFLTGLGVAAAVAAVLLAYPLYTQFFGPRSYGHLPWIANFPADLAAYPAFSPLSLGGDPSARQTNLGQNITELNAFFGWPLLLLVVAIVVWLRREVAARIAAVVAVVFAALSLGREITINGQQTGVPGPWRPFSALPVFDAVVATRFALVTTAAIGVLLALALDRAVRSGGPRLLGVPRTAWVWGALMVVALLPLAPRPLAAAGVPPVPEFFANGAYRPYVTGDGAVMVVPPLRPYQISTMRWAAAERVRFRMTDGRFLAPAAGDPERRGSLSHPIARTGQLAIDASRHGDVPLLTEADRAQAREELRGREVAIVVLPADLVHADAIRATMDGLLGPGRLVSDVWVWDVREPGGN